MSFSNIPSFARSCSPAGTASRLAVTPRPGSIFTKTREKGCLRKARGQFAVSLWDRNTRTLILGRDRVGICPLYYTQVDGWLLWASEIKALLASGMVAARPDARGIDHLFTFFCAGPPAPSSRESLRCPLGTFSGSGMAGSASTCTGTSTSPTPATERRLDDPTPLVEELESLLQQSVERRLRSDVPVVSYISGGLDSTVVLGFCSRHRGEPIPSFTIGFDKAGPDERAHATEAARCWARRSRRSRWIDRRSAPAFPS